jgi:hypothetical protein
MKKIALAITASLALSFSGCYDGFLKDGIDFSDLIFGDKDTVTKEVTEVKSIAIPAREHGYSGFDTQVIHSEDELNSFLRVVDESEHWNNKEAFVEKVSSEDVNFTASNMVLYRITEGSGSITVTPQKPAYTVAGDIVVKVSRDIPEKVTADMAEYCYAYVVDKSVDAITFDVEGKSTDTITLNEKVALCTKEFAPVCAEKSVVCITEPCEPVYETYSNRCMLDADSSAKFLYEGECSSDKPDDGVICTADYSPVCGSKEIQCVTTPCDPVLETYSNRCHLDADVSATYLFDGECTQEVPDNCVAWNDGCNDCTKDVDGNVACTERFCIVPDGPTVCTETK